MSHHVAEGLASIDLPSVAAQVQQVPSSCGRALQVHVEGNHGQPVEVPSGMDGRMLRTSKNATQSYANGKSWSTLSNHPGGTLCNFQSSSIYTSRAIPEKTLCIPGLLHTRAALGQAAVYLLDSLKA